MQRSKLATPELIEAVTERGAAQLLKSTRKFLPNGSEADQSCVLTHLLAFATSNEATDTTLHYCFRVILYFCICSTSQVSRKATMRATEMCHRFGITPKTLLVWHKTNLFKLIVPLCVSNYLNHGISLEKSLHGVISIGKRKLKMKIAFHSFFIHRSVICLATLTIANWILLQKTAAQ